MSGIPTSPFTKAKGVIAEIVSVPVDEAEKASPKFISAQQFEQRLKTKLAEKGSVVAGKMHFLDLSVIRERHSDRWPRISRIVMPGVRRLIERQLGPDDFVTSHGDAYILVFPKLSKQEAQLQCAMILKLVESWLFGEAGDHELLNAKTVVATIDGSIDFEAIPGLEALERVFGQAEAAPPAPGGEFPDGLQSIYRAMWHARRKVVASYACVPASTTASGEFITGERVIPPNATAADVAKLDHRILGTVFADLNVITKKEGRVFSSFPVHYATIADGVRREGFSKRCREIPRHLRSLLIAEVVGLPPKSREIEFALALVLSVLKPVTYGLLARFALDHADFASCKKIGFLGVGVDLTEVPGSEDEVIPQFEIFTERANKYGLRTYVHGLDSLSLTTAAVCAGFDHVDGEAVASLVGRPEGVYPLDAFQLYAPLLETGSAND